MQQVVGVIPDAVQDLDCLERMTCWHPQIRPFGFAFCCFLYWSFCNGKFQVVLGLKYQCHAIMSSCIEDFAEVLQLLCIEVPAGCCVELGLHLQAPQYQATCAACQTSQVHYEKSLGMNAWSWRVQCLFDWISFWIIVNTLVLPFSVRIVPSVVSAELQDVFFLLLLS